MTQRDRHTPDSGALTPPTRTAPAGAAIGCAWDEVLASLPPARRRELLELAGRQGVIYAHQLPAGNGPANRPLLPAILNGQTHDLAPLRPTAALCLDADLDAAQRDAVARALLTPDVCLIQGHPGSGKSRTAAEIVAEAAGRGERVLLLAPTAAAVDCVLERLNGRDGVCAARCLSAGERPEGLPPGLRRLVFEERLRTFREQTLPAAKQAAEEAARRCEIRRHDEEIWATLASLAGRREEFAQESRRLAEALGRLEDEVAAEASHAGGASPFQQELAACRAARDQVLIHIDARLAELRAETEKVHGERQAADDEAARLRPLAEAVQARRWWTGAYWRARGEGEVARRLDELARRQKELIETADRLGRECDEQTAERDRVEARCRDETAVLQGREVERRRLEREERRAVLAREERALEEQAEAASRGLSEGTAAPVEPSIAAVCQGRDAWRSLLEQDERQAAQAVRWAGAVEATMDALPEKLMECVNVVGSVLSALPGDPRFGDRASPRVTFDLLVLEESQLVTESDFLAAARRARRWVLIGEPTDDHAPPTRPAGERRGSFAPSRPSRPSTLRPGFFQRLWRLLHTDPRCLPYAWFHRDTRLVCRLRPEAADEERWMTSEHVADRPEIELRIAAPPRTPPRLLEVVFPGATTIHEAKSFIFRELGELPVQARGGGFRWHEEGERLALDVSDGAVPDAEPVALAEGVCERVGEAAPGVGAGAAWHTCSLEFDRAAGWTRERAEQWVEEHLPTRSLGRTVRLNTPHRQRPALAHFLSGLLHDGALPSLIAAGQGGGDGPVVEFVPVPSLDEDAARRRPAPSSLPPRAGEGGAGRRGGTATIAPRLRSSRGGAGLEVDLADPRRHDPLPPELRAALPRQGLVNLFEARAVVRTLDTLAADPAFRAAAEEWARRQARPCGAGAGCGSASCQTSAIPCVGRRPAVAVLALYPAQAELIRLLAAQSATLAAAAVAVEIGMPDAFRQRECFAALISLTRSHSHRAVPFGGDPSLLATALTRAASRLILFGDAGTLARRCQWNGSVEHLDEASGERERGRIGRLVAYLHGDGPHPSTFGVAESGRA